MFSISKLGEFLGHATPEKLEKWLDLAKVNHCLGHLTTKVVST